MVNLIPIAVFSVAIWHSCVAPPVTKNKKEENEDNNVDGVELSMHYHRYLREVVGVLESDPEFKKKLENADESEIRSGKIADELEFVSHNVRTKLDEIKRFELERLRTLTKQQRELTDNTILDDPNHGHLDRSNPHTFEISDLKKLIAKTTEDLAEADRKRREEFKQYELQKEFEKQDKLNHTNGDDREKLVKEYEDMEGKHRKHEKLHEPGHKAQLEEVWEEQDHMQQEFDPKTFFMLHDVDSNGLWDENEVKALFVKELDKMYAAGAPEDDLRERYEEMERMRETVFREVDTNRDGFIDFHEFLTQTKKQEFQQDHGWKGIDEQKPYTDEELEAYIRQQQMMHPPPPPGYHVPPPPGHYPPPPGGYHPNQVPQGGYQQQMQHPAQGGHPPLNSNEVYYNQAQQQDHRAPVPPGGQSNYAPHGQPNYQQQGSPGYQPHPGQPNRQPPQGQANYQPSQGHANYQPSQGQDNYQLNQHKLNQGLNNPSPPHHVSQGHNDGEMHKNSVNQGQQNDNHQEQQRKIQGQPNDREHLKIDAQGQQNVNEESPLNMAKSNQEPNVQAVPQVQQH